MSGHSKWSKVKRFKGALGAAPAGARSRNNRDAPFRMHRRPFFPPPNQRNEARPCVAKHTLHGGQGPKAWEGVCIHQAASLSFLAHRAIMPNFSAGKGA